MKVVVTGITGFIGRLLIAELIRAGHEVVGISRDPARFHLGVPVLRGDIAADTSWSSVLRGADIAYYLVHSFERGNREGFAVRDRRAAQNFATVARQAGIGRIVYCGVSAPNGTVASSAHRRSRIEVEDILLSAVPRSVSMRTWTILAPDNQFIRFLLALIRARPTLVLPPSATFRFRPIDGRDLGQALAAAASGEELSGKAVDLAGPSAVSTIELCVALAGALGLTRKIVRLPFNPPRFLLQHLVCATGQDPALILPALASARAGDVLPEDDTLQRLVPNFYSLAESIAYAANNSTTHRHGSTL